MSTLANIADEAQNVLSDSAAATWSQATVEEWINAAIRDYSNHFPRLVETTQSTTADDRTYDLPADFQTMVKVEYPDGQDPPEYLSRLSYKHPQFWQGDYWYDVVFKDNVADAAEFWMSKKPAASETIRWHYLATHDFTLASGGTVTVPEQHENLLIAFVVWKAHQELLMAEQQSPTSNSSLLMGQLANNADRAKRAYFQAVAQALRGREGTSAQLAWRPGGSERIY
jgi:hypothetical protein